MILCPNCNTNQLDGTIFCLDCGASLQVSHSFESTRQIGAGDGPQTSGLGAAESVSPAMPGPMITLVIAHNGRRLMLDVSDELLIGRADTAKGIYPDIDLGAEGGYDAGVSRRHAILSIRNGMHIVEDLGSANGTYVNGRRLAPEAAVSLNAGDELRCGTLVMLVEIGR
jgi:pSer/pThr/pTyr-binding forkhead associated (FHA) protein